MNLKKYLIDNGIEFSELPDNLTVGGHLDLELTNISELPDNLTVGGYLNLRGTNISELPDNKKETSFLSWKNGKYIKVDGVFCEVIANKGSIWKCKKVNKNNEFYIVMDNEGNYSHGSTLKEAKEDLIYKITNKCKDDYKDFTKKSVLSFNEMIECYRVITGACSFGVKDFIKSNNIQKKEISIQEVIKLTEGSYGASEFSNFFNK